MRNSALNAASLQRWSESLYSKRDLFYNTTAPGIILVLNKAKPKERQGKLFLLNATNEFTKGDPKNYLADDAIIRIADTSLFVFALPEPREAAPVSSTTAARPCGLRLARMICTQPQSALPPG